jgi:hypothetical protein
MLFIVSKSQKEIHVGSTAFRYQFYPPSINRPALLQNIRSAKVKDGVRNYRPWGLNQLRKGEKKY